MSLAQLDSPGVVCVCVVYSVCMCVCVRVLCVCVCSVCVCVSALKPGRVIRVTFSPDHPGPTRFTNYPGLTRIGSREKRDCSFDDVETYKR